MPEMTDTDVLVSGGGVAGLTAAAAFGSAGFSVICVDPAPPVTEMAAEGSDLRTTAFLQPSLEVLERAGLWQRLDTVQPWESSKLLFRKGNGSLSTWMRRGLFFKVRG